MDSRDEIAERMIERGWNVGWSPVEMHGGGAGWSADAHRDGQRVRAQGKTVCEALALLERAIAAEPLPDRSPQCHSNFADYWT